MRRTGEGGFLLNIDSSDHLKFTSSASFLVRSASGGACTRRRKKPAKISVFPLYLVPGTRPAQLYRKRSRLKSARLTADQTSSIRSPALLRLLPLSRRRDAYAFPEVPQQGIHGIQRAQIKAPPLPRKQPPVGGTQQPAVQQEDHAPVVGGPDYPSGRLLDLVHPGITVSIVKAAVFLIEKPFQKLPFVTWGSPAPTTTAPISRVPARSSPSEKTPPITQNPISETGGSS